MVFRAGTWLMTSLLISYDMAAASGWLLGWAVRLASKHSAGRCAPITPCTTCPATESLPAPPQCPAATATAPCQLLPCLTASLLCQLAGSTGVVPAVFIKAVGLPLIKSLSWRWANTELPCVHLHTTATSEGGSLVHLGAAIQPLTRAIAGWVTHN